ncbi:MAG: 4-hydroxy-tetrahydrodipicolinate reductase [Planctomycetota bacterium]|jgi:4-hydroxy-tetrahydrodipicolinate reductase
MRDTNDTVLRIACLGAAGKMGSFTQRLVESVPDIEIVAEIGRGQDIGAALRDSGATIGVDFTVAGSGAKNAHVMLEAGVRPLIGTSGVQPEEDRELDAAARELGLGGLIVPNFCMGVWLQQRLAMQAARLMQYVEIVEEHSITKIDAPSGTATDTAAQLAAVMGRESSEIPVHSVRLPGLHSNQSIHFGSAGEELRIIHRTYGLEAFGPGILAGIRYVATATGIARGVGVAFDAASHSPVS